jgi:Reverse transcriptase (RNA-dependent DNA polymerase)
MVESELLMKEQIMDFFTRNCLLNLLQFGSRPAHSTTSAMLNVTDDFRKASERRFLTVLLLLDFSKAFDSVVHDLLCSKLSSKFKFHSTATALVKSYLSDRCQCFCNGEEISSFAPILRGVVQGSILGQVLFSLFINNLLDVIIFCQTHLYADDVKIYVSGEQTDAVGVTEKLNVDLSSIWDLSQAIIINLQSQISVLPPILLNGCVVPYCNKVLITI